MTLFWFLGALLAAGAVAGVARPLWRRRASSAPSREAMNAAVFRDQLRELDADLAAGTLAQADYDRAKQEIERRVLEDFSHVEKRPGPLGGNRLVAYGVVAVPLLALGIYFAVGNPAAIAPGDAAQREIEAMVERLAARLQNNPEDVEGWKMLGRSYSVLGRFPDAVNAYAKAATRAPRDPDILVDLADALAMANGERLAGDLEALIERALAIDPQNLKGLALAGTAAFQRGNFAAAASRWERMLPLVPPDSEDARVIRSNIEEARAKAGLAAAPSGPAAGPAVKLAGTVSLSAKLKGQAAPDDTVFIFARAAEGPRVPLAVLRKKVRDLPVSFSLDDSMAMAPGMTLSAFQRVVVSARVSKAGSATPQAGDLQGASAVVANDATGVKLVIDSVVSAN
jgi:cytochrome c-type biogenesis protein CcmH